MGYQYEVTSPTGFVQQLVTNYLRHGYWFYVSGCLTEGKDPRALDEKLVNAYGVALSRQQRTRRKQAGFANLHYLRFDRWWVLLSTHGQHRFFELEAKNIRDIRAAPLQFRGYSIAMKDAGPRVLIARKRFQELKAYFLDLATHRTAENLAREFWGLPFEPYAPVRKQLLQILHQVNEQRRRAGFEVVPPRVIRTKREIGRVFQRERDNFATDEATVESSTHGDLVVPCITA
jgi:hypothetical protein